MKDMQVHLEKLRMQAAKCETIRARPQIKRSGSFLRASPGLRGAGRQSRTRDEHHDT